MKTWNVTAAGLAAGLAMMLAAGSALGAEPRSGAVPSEATPDLSKEPTLYVVGYAHLDTEWRWSYPQTIREYLPDTMLRNFPLFEKYPGYVFNFSGSRRYQMMREYYPEDYAKVKAYVAAGRWFPCGSSVDENDANVPSGESQIRHVLYGNRFFLSEFGIASDEFMLPDCFGFPAALPSVLAHCGLTGFSTQKLTWGSPVGIPFKVGVWEGPDGRGVIAALDPGSYVGEVRDNLATSESWRKRIEANGAKSGVFVDYHYYGTGDMGGAPTEGSVAMVEESIRTEGPVRVISAAADRMFKAITPEMRERLPRYKGELLLTEHSAGSITSQSSMKRWNRKNELLADAAERASVAAAWLGTTPYPAARLEEAWTLVLGSQMHDILPGTSLPKAYEYAWNDELLALNMFAAVTQDAVGATTQSMDTRAEGVPLVVYNALAVAREDVVEATVRYRGAAPRGVRVVGPDGADVPAQVVSAAEGNAKVLFLAKVGGTGLGTFDVRLEEGGEGDEASATGALKVGPDSLENGRFIVRLDANGDVASVFDKDAGRETLSAPARLAFHYENPREWPAWNMDWADRQKPARGFVGGPATVRIVERGPARVALEVERESEGSRFVQRISLGAGAAGDRVEFDTTIDWNTRERSLKATFPLVASNPIATYDIQVGAIERGNNTAARYENPSHQWFDLTDASGGHGVTVMNDSRYGSDKPDDSTLRLTLLYTPGVRGSYQDQGTQDIGRHRVLYALAPHAGGWREAGMPASAARLNQPLMAFRVLPHDGPLGRSFSLLTVESDRVTVVALKKAEASDEVIVRLRETTGAAAVGVRVSMPSPIASAREVDGQERPIGPATVVDGALVTDIHGYGLRAFALTLGPAPAAGSRPISEPLALPFDTDAVSGNEARGDGAMDGAGRTYPSEQLPREIVSDGIEFRLGSGAAGAMNAVACRGQEVALPEGGFDHVYVLAASMDGDVPATFGVGDEEFELEVQAWDGYIGQWDNRLWAGEVPEQAFAWTNEWAGLEPGYVRRDPVAWYASHYHTPGGDAHYQYCYLFKYVLDVPAGARSVRLPRADGVRIFAMTAARDVHDHAFAAAPLYDVLEERPMGAPAITARAGSGATPASGVFDDAATVTISPGLYWYAGGVRYTTDGSEPTLGSEVYAAPFAASERVRVRARVFDRAGKGGPITDAVLEVVDTTPPRVLGLRAVTGAARIDVTFSEPVDRAAADRARFTLEPAVEVRDVEVAADGRSATLTLAGPLPDGVAHALRVAGVRDASPAGNALAEAAGTVVARGPVFHLAEVSAAQRGTTIRAEGLPTKGGSPWTLAMLVRAQKQPDNRTIIAGFGACDDRGGADGRGRYLSKFANGVHFWSRNSDVEGKAPLTLGTWQMLAATYDGRTLRLYKEDALLAEGGVTLADDEPVINLMPVDPWEKKRRFEGDVRAVTVWDEALPAESLAAWRSGIAAGAGLP